MEKKLIHTIALNYRGSIYFDEVFPLIEKLIKSDYGLLYEYNANIIKEISFFLDIETEIVSNNKNYFQLETDLNQIANNNYTLFPGLLKTTPLKKAARVLQICQMEKANTFINAIGGQGLYNKREFEEYNIKLYFIETRPYAYKQFSESFFSHLSIVDVLMHNGKEGTKNLLHNYNLI
ncbi:MAG TPA: WbqC family protein [Pseudomonadales bacterium]|nr:WbqC family protein [Pseudomonadales bacterium]